VEPGYGNAVRSRLEGSSFSGAGVSADQHVSLSEASAPLGDAKTNDVSAETASSGYGHPRHVWAHRFGVLLFVFFCAVLGVVLVIFPWRDEWTNNSFLFGHPALQDFVADGFVRGICSGLGVIDIWIGFWEAVHYHE
jgi:hypothetical protein